MKDKTEDKVRPGLVSFGTRTVQKGRRITLSDDLLENLDVKEGDQVKLFFDSKEKAIIVKKSLDSPSRVKLRRRKERKAKAG